MLVFEDSAVAVDEPKSTWIEVRTQPSMKDAIKLQADRGRAAARKTCGLTLHQLVNETLF